MELDSDSFEDDEIDEVDLLNDDDLNDIVDKDVDSIEKEKCLLCGEFGKDGETWYRFVCCGWWTHAEYSEGNSAIDYKCDLCRQKSSAKMDLVKF